eukprot:4553091-Ditylum_brightwellii.AAC.2
MEAHKVVANDTKIKMVAIQDSLDRFDNIEDPRANDFLTKDELKEDKELSELGLYASRQACEKAGRLTSTHKTPTQKSKNNDDTSSVVTKVTKNKNPAKSPPLCCTKRQNKD